MTVLCQVVSKFKFQGEQERDLSFSKNSIIDVYGKTKNGWWLGRISPDGDAGYFPSNYVKELEKVNKSKQLLKSSIVSNDQSVRSKKIKNNFYNEKYNPT